MDTTAGDDLLGMPTNNEPRTQLCIRCGVHMDRNLPPQLVLEFFFTNEFNWRINIGGLAMPLVLLARFRRGESFLMGLGVFVFNKNFG